MFRDGCYPAPTDAQTHHSVQVESVKGGKLPSNPLQAPLTLREHQVQLSEGVLIHQKSQGSWQKVVHRQFGKDPLVELDREMEATCAATREVLHVSGRLGSWRRDRVIIDDNPPPVS